MDQSTEMCTWIKSLTLKLHNIACDAEMLDMTCEDKAYPLGVSVSVVRDLVRSLIEWLYTGLKKDKIALRDLQLELLPRFLQWNSNEWNSSI
jgi:hypothetical protein